MELPEGSRILSPEEAIQILKSGDHVGSMPADLDVKKALDRTFINLLEEDLITAAVQPDGQLAFGWVSDEQRIRFLRRKAEDN